MTVETWGRDVTAETHLFCSSPLSATADLGSDPGAGPGELWEVVGKENVVWGARTGGPSSNLEPEVDGGPIPCPGCVESSWKPVVIPAELARGIGHP